MRVINNAAVNPGTTTGKSAKTLSGNVGVDSAGGGRVSCTNVVGSQDTNGMRNRIRGGCLWLLRRVYISFDVGASNSAGDD